MQTPSKFIMGEKKGEKKNQLSTNTGSNLVPAQHQKINKSKENK
jgi:hypothetical protein